jgi:hypothetical protein
MAAAAERAGPPCWPREGGRSPVATRCAWCERSRSAPRREVRACLCSQSQQPATDSVAHPLGGKGTVRRERSSPSVALASAVFSEPRACIGAAHPQGRSRSDDHSGRSCQPASVSRSPAPRLLHIVPSGRLWQVVPDARSLSAPPRPTRVGCGFTFPRRTGTCSVHNPVRLAARCLSSREPPRDRRACRRGYDQNSSHA